MCNFEMAGIARSVVIILFNGKVRQAYYDLAKTRRFIELAVNYTAMDWSTLFLLKVIIYI